MIRDIRRLLGFAAGGTSEPASTIKVGIEGPFAGPKALTGDEMTNACGTYEPRTHVRPRR